MDSPRLFCRLLRRVKAGRIFRFDEVQEKLPAALKVTRGIELAVVFAGGFLLFQIVDQIDQGVHRQVAQAVNALLNRLSRDTSQIVDRRVDRYMLALGDGADDIGAADDAD
jgi:hypothetical protein